MRLSQSPILERQAAVHDFNPIVYHYVKKIDISRSTALNMPSSALCGDRKVFSDPIAGRPVDAKQGRTICPLCQLVYDGMTLRKGLLNG